MPRLFDTEERQTLPAGKPPPFIEEDEPCIRLFVATLKGA
jgi:hypothetical protein